MDFNQFPAQWEWDALILGLAGFLMAVSPFVQLYWSKPKIQITFRDDFHSSGAKVFRVYLENLPPLGITRILHLSRTPATSVGVNYTIRELHSGKEIIGVAPRITLTPNDIRYLVTLSPYTVPVSITVGGFDDTGAFVFKPDESRMTLAVGEYDVQLNLSCAELGIIRKSWQLNVGNTLTTSGWFP